MIHTNYSLLENTNLSGLYIGLQNCIMTHTNYRLLENTYPSGLYIGPQNCVIIYINYSFSLDTYPSDLYIGLPELYYNANWLQSSISGKWFIELHYNRYQIQSFIEYNSVMILQFRGQCSWNALLCSIQVFYPHV